MRYIFSGCGETAEVSISQPIDATWSRAMSTPLKQSQEEIMRAIFKHPVYSESWRFTTLHKIVTGLSDVPLALELNTSASNIDAGDRYGDTPLHWAVRRSGTAVVQSLLNAEAKPNLFGKSQSTPLHRAISARSLELLNALIVHRAEISLTEADGSTALHHASRSESSVPDSLA